MPKLNLITPPDKLFNDCITITMVYPSNAIKDEMQAILHTQETDINVYVYELGDKEQNLDWLLSVCRMSDYVILDLDNSSQKVRMLASYLIAKSNTYWLTQAPNSVYTMLSVKQIYNLDFLKQEGKLNE
jgi:hypothetical protein